jgi:uncharacterized repeat protein (TIGR03803 family)
MTRGFESFPENQKNGLSAWIFAFLLELFYSLKIVPSYVVGDAGGPMSSMINALGKSLVLRVLLVAFLAQVSSAQAGGVKVLHTFAGYQSGDGSNPWAALVEDTAGNLYGTTFGGGVNNAGTVFKLAPDNTETVLHSFCSNCSDGYDPRGDLIIDGSGNLYGTTQYGGDANGQGTVFKLAQDGTESILHAFTGAPGDGQYPFGGLIADKAGNLYGTTSTGGADNTGTLFKLAPNGTESVLYSFKELPDGSGPVGDLIMDKAGNLYGTTPSGGANNSGTLFIWAPKGGYKVLHSFTGAPGDGAQANPSLIIDRAGNLYGTTYAGGANSAGTIFKMTPNFAVTLLHSFCSQANCADGMFPTAGLVMDKAGILYGTTSGGGANREGTVFQLAPDGAETTLHSLCQDKCKDGALPLASLILDKRGNLYGTTLEGGKDGNGTAFRLKK